MNKRYLLFITFFISVAFGILGLSSCSKELAAPENVYYNGSSFFWSEVKGADEYKIKINGTQYYSDDNDLLHYGDGTDYTVEVVAVDSEGKRESKPIIKTFKYLPEVENFRYTNNYRFMWSLSPGATGYSIRIHGETYKTTSYYFDYFEEGFFYASIKPIVDDDDENSYYSIENEIRVTVLSTPKNIDYNFNTHYITWDPVDDAFGYELNLSGKIIKLKSSEHSYYYDDDVKSFDFSIRALGLGSYIFDSKESSKKTYTYLDEINEITVDNGILRWNEVKDAKYYEVNIKSNGFPEITKKVSTPYFSDLESGRLYKIVVTAYGDDETYCPSKTMEFNCNILSTPNLDFVSNSNVNSETANIISWTAVNNESLIVDGYNLLVTLNGKTVFEKSFDSETLSCNEYQFEEVGEYKIKVKANAKKGTINYDSVYSKEWTVIRLGGIESAEVAGNNTDNPTISFKNVEGSPSYNIKKDGVEIESENTSRTFDINIVSENGIEKIVTYEIKANGSISKEDRKVILGTTDSETYRIEITKLAKPNVPVVIEKKVSFDSVSKATSYNIYLDDDLIEIDDTTFYLPGLDSGKHTLRIQALSDSETVLCSEISEEITMTKLDTPKNIRMSNRTLYWDKCVGTTAYSVFINGTVLNVENNNSLPIDTQYITEEGSAIYVIARGNKADIIDSENSDVVKVFKLAKVSNLEVNKDGIYWNSVSKATGYQVLINNNNSYYDKNITETFVDSSMFKVGSSNISIIALGDDNYYYDSEPSQVLSVEKLVNPEVRIDKNKYVWDYIFGAQNYEVVIGDKIFTINKNEFDPKNAFDKEGTYKVQIRALGGDAVSGNKRNISSDFTEIEQKVSQLTKPINVKHVYDSETGKATVTVDPYANQNICSGYNFFVGGVNKGVQKENSFSYDIVNSGKYSANVIFIGGVFEENIYYISSEASNDATIEILEQPRDVQIIKIGSICRVTWRNINSSNNVILTIKINGDIYLDYDNKELVENEVILTGVNDGDLIEIQIVSASDIANVYNSTKLVITKQVTD